MTAEPAATAPWRVPVRRDKVPESGLHLDLVADEATRSAIARIAGVVAVTRLSARLDIVRQGNGLHVAGELLASVAQTCVVTLEPMESDIRAPIDVVFVQPGPVMAKDEPVEEIDPIDADETEPLVDGIADVGALATEFLLLAIDPYPRKPGAAFAAPRIDEPGDHPFAALAALKKPPADR
jgi:uncharacterized protein DUF177 involved in 23S rRNA accumulation